MDQQQLREIEYRCIQEEQPFCTASCPIHVDVRAFMACLAKGDLRGARRILDRTMPFPEIVGRLCDQPCYPFCKRGEIGDPLCTGRLERYCVSNSSSVLKLPKLPTKDGRIAIVGGGLSGMTAALDLARKGRNITLVTRSTGLGGTLRNFDETLLPKETLVQAEAILESYGVRLQTGTTLTENVISSLVTEYDAVYFDLDEITQDQLPVNAGRPDPMSLALGFGGGFAGGGFMPDVATFSVIKQVEDGRRAGLTIERSLQKASLSAQREMEGTRTTRMYTVTTGIAPAAEIVPADPVVGYTGDEAQREAGRCIHCECLECVKQCVYLREFKEYPKTLLRKIYNNQAIVQGTRGANKMINSCSLCTQCTMICPNDFPVAEVCRTTRQEMVDNNHMPPSAHDFALEDMRFSLSEFCSLNRHQPDTSASRYVFYPGCQLAGSAPEAVKNSYRLLRGQLAGGVGLMLGCCGIPAHWAGQEALFTETMDLFKKEIEQLGNPTVITACSSCLSIFREFAAGIEAVSLWEVLDTLQLPGVMTGKASMANICTTGKPKQPLTIHDPCTARHNEALRAAVRNICAKLGLDIIEHDFNGELTDCCGYGGLMQFANPPLGGKAARVKAERSEHAGLAYCAMCRDNLAAAGSPVAHLLDFIFPESGVDPLSRKDPGFSERHENRARLKEQLLTCLWGEAAGPGPDHKKIRLILSREVLELLNSRHILEEDVRKVILQAEQTGKHLVNPHNNRRLASFKPVRVTYWVEYEPTAQGYLIHNGYSHRMQLPEEIS
jgi:Fe-S oxidoreductase